MAARVRAKSALPRARSTCLVCKYVLTYNMLCSCSMLICFSDTTIKLQSEAYPC
jgi:hypothetical protein